MKKLLILSSFLITFASPVMAKDFPDFTTLVEKQGAAVVNISSTQTIHVKGADVDISPFIQLPDEIPQIFGDRDVQEQSLGSGFIISADGYILTNAHVVSDPSNPHVVSDADEVIVKLTDRREFKAKIVGIDRRSDVALLKIDATNLPKVTIGDVNNLKVGEWVLAIGSPYGLENTVTAGIVSAKGRALPQENYVPFIQTDVAINQGNSGGPLFNMKGEVVGINSRLLSPSGAYAGLSFAIPIDVAMDVQNQLRVGGKVSRGWLGVQIQGVTRELADSFGMKNATGALVADVMKDGPADKAGLEAGDVITKFDGKPIITSADLPRAVGATKPGKDVVVELFRKGAAKSMTLKIGKIPEEGDDVSVTKSPRNGSAKTEPNKLGLLLRDLTPQEHKVLNGKSGVLIVGVQGAAVQAGIRRGDVLLAIGANEIQSVDQVNKLVEGIAPGKPIALRLKRGDTTSFITLKTPAK
jgi:serine protease Do